MKKLAIGWFIIAMVGATFADLAVAGSKYEAPVVCDLNNDGTIGGDGDGVDGTVTITKAGKLTFSMEGLTPGTTFSCELVCTGESVYVGVDANCGTAGSNGKVFTTIRDFVDFATLCRGPVMKFTASVPEGPIGECISGWGTGGDGGSECSGSGCQNT
jgi:hypothetical protein